MKKYKYDGNKVIETATKYVIQITPSKDDAKKLAARLNGGAGFNGETPRFFVYAKDQPVSEEKHHKESKKAV